MKNDEQLTTVQRDRLQRLVDVLSIVSVGEYEPEALVIETEHEDELAHVEETLNILLRELAESRLENEKYIRALEQSKRELQEKLSTIERQELAIRDLSTPIIELWDDILTLPLVGVVDTERSVEMTEQLLHRIVSSGAACVIIDVTGVDVVDTMTADHFIKMIKAAQLLGAYCVVTGISPDIAQTLVRIGVDLSGVRTLRSLKEGLKDCFLYLKSTEGAAHGAAARSAHHSPVRP